MTVGRSPIAFQRQILVRPRERPIGNKSQSRLLDPRANSAREGDLPDRRNDDAFGHKLLHLMENGFTFHRIEFGGLLLEQSVEVWVTAVSPNSAGDDHGLQASGGIQNLPRRRK
jgi:hypothetical protein